MIKKIWVEEKFATFLLEPETVMIGITPYFDFEDDYLDDDEIIEYMFDNGLAIKDTKDATHESYLLLGRFCGGFVFCFQEYRSRGIMTFGIN